MNHDLISRQLHYDFRTKHGNSWLFSQFFFHVALQSVEVLGLGDAEVPVSVLIMRYRVGGV
jgi:hypothetical protein